MSKLLPLRPTKPVNGKASSPAASAPENRELITELPSKFGRVEQVLPIDSWDLLTRLVPDDMVLQEGAPFDTEVLVPLLAYIAKNVIEYFQASLRDLFPEAREITMDELEGATSDSGTAFFLLVAPLKGGVGARLTRE